MVPEDEERQEGEVQAVVAEVVDGATAVRAVSEETLASLARRSSLSRRVLWAEMNDERTAALAMMSAVLAKCGLRPRRRLRTS